MKENVSRTEEVNEWVELRGMNGTEDGWNRKDGWN